MRGTLAKKIRREVYGHSSGNDTDLRVYGVMEKTGMVVADAKRRAYRFVKKYGLGKIKELMAQEEAV
jgi:hypothetical protein